MTWFYCEFLAQLKKWQYNSDICTKNKQYNQILKLELPKVRYNKYYMGNSNNRNNRNPQQNSHIISSTSQMKCPKCGFSLPPHSNVQEFANHIRNCFNEQNPNIPQQIAKHPLAQKSANTQHEKIPVDYSMTKFKWQNRPVKPLDPSILNIKNVSDVKKLSFQQKQYWFRSNLQKHRISWQKGADWMKIERSNILMSSLNQYQKVNMHKQVKIQFVGQKVNDAGGLLRQWSHMVMKQVFDQSTGIFTIANCQDIVYKLKWDEDLDQQFSEQLFHLFGTIIGKVIFERIPIMCYMDRTLLRQICEDPVKIQDIYGYDIQLYKNWIFILESEDIEDLDVYFVIHKNNGDTVQQIQLVENGRDVQVTNQNRFKYIDLCIQTQTMKRVTRSVNAIKQGIRKIIPAGLLNIFQPYQLQMVLYGVPFIDLQDWKQNTQYKPPYSFNHKVITWFWKTMQQFDQQQLANILHFCTGSSRTPIHGFKKLESNRGNYSKFLIESAAFTKTNPFPKGHTCFNRLQMPQYPNLDTLKIYLTAISKNNLDGVFGLD